MEKTKIAMEASVASYMLGQGVREMRVQELEDYIGFMIDATKFQEEKLDFEHGEQALAKLMREKPKLYGLSSRTILCYQPSVDILESALEVVDPKVFSTLCNLSGRYKDECKPNPFAEC